MDQMGQPDLRGRFVVGHDPTDTNNNFKTFNSVGGKDTKLITEQNIHPHRHILRTDNGSVGQPAGGKNKFKYHLGSDQDKYTGNQNIKSESTGRSSKQLSGWRNIPQNNSPPYYVMLYVMKII